MGHVDTEPQHTVFSNYQAITSKTFVVSLLVEFIGVMIFTFLGSSINDKIVGAIFGALLVAALVPGVSIGQGDGAPGCFDSTILGPGLTKGQLFGWEVVMTFTLISVVYACGVAKPGHGSFTPLVVGLSLVACAGTGGKWTGAALNPARVLGPLAVFRCGKNVAWIYILAELLAALLSCSIFAFVSGWGPLSPMASVPSLNLSPVEAGLMWVTGSPPRRFQHSGRENITDVMTERSARKDAVEAAALAKEVGP